MRQALAPCKGVAAGVVAVGADGVEAVAHEVGILAEGLVVGKVEGSLDVGCCRGAGAAAAQAASGRPAAAARAARRARLQSCSCALLLVAWSSRWRSVGQ